MHFATRFAFCNGMEGSIKEETVGARHASPVIAHFKIKSYLFNFRYRVALLIPSA